MDSRTVLLLIGLFLVAGCASMDGFPPATAKWTDKVPADEKIEVTLSPSGFGVTEVEFYLTKDDIDVKYHKLAGEVMIGEIIETQVEYHGPNKYYVITTSGNGKAQEVMFNPDGSIHRWELEIAAKDVPERPMKLAKGMLPGAKLTKCEEIRDGTNDLLEYHFKFAEKGIKYKVVVPVKQDAEYPVVVYRETMAELEIPVRR